MDTTTDSRMHDLSAYTPYANPPGYPEGKVIGALDRSAVGAAVTELRASGVSATRVTVATTDDVTGLEAHLTRGGLAGTLGRFVFSLGGELDAMKWIRQELARDRVLIFVTVEGNDARNQVRDIVHHHGSHGLKYFGRWTITSLA